MKRISVVAALLISVAAPASAASMQKVSSSDWSVTGLPSYVTMYIYVPDKLAAKPPIVVVPHHCQGTGSSSYSEMSGLVTIANTNGFIMIFPEATGQNCWDAGSARSLKHDGGGDTQAIVQMVKYALNKYGGDASRVYSVGGSSGGIMTEALLGVYPDVFMAGISIMGVPCGCWAASYNDVVGKPASGTGQWSAPCAGGTVSNTGEQWAALVRSYFPGYTGHRPRLQHWHGTADTTLSYKNVAEDVKEWTTLLGLSATPTGTDTPQTGTTRQFWKNSCGYTVYETFSLAGTGHSVGVSATDIAAYFGLDKADGVDPEVAACPSDAGAGGKDASADVLSGTGGAGGIVGSGGAGGTATNGGASGSGGARPSGGASGTGGSSSAGGSTASGQTGGSAGQSSGGTSGQSSGGATAKAGGNTGAAGSVATTSGGCSCALGGHRRQDAITMTLALTVAAGGWRRRKSKRQETR